MTVEAKIQALEGVGIVVKPEIAATMSDQEFNNLLSTATGYNHAIEPQSERTIIKRLMQLATREFNETVLSQEKHLSRSGTHVPVELIHTATELHWKNIIADIDLQFGGPTIIDRIWGWLIITFKRK